MAEQDTTTASTSETPNDADPQGETPTTSTASETLESTSPDDLAKEIERLKTSLKRANAEAKQYREKATELDTLKKQAEDKNLSETERLQKELAAIKAQHEEAIQAQTERAIKHEVALEAAKLGVDPAYLDKVARFLDWEEIDVDDRGNPTNVHDLVAQLVKEMPGLKSRGATSAPTASNPTNPARSQVNNGDITASYVADVMSGKIPWQSLTPERRNAIINWQAKNAYRF